MQILAVVNSPIALEESQELEFRSLQFKQTHLEVDKSGQDVKITDMTGTKGQPSERFSKELEMSLPMEASIAPSTPSFDSLPLVSRS